MKKKIYDIVFAAQYEGLSTKEATDQLLALFDVVGRSEQLVCDNHHPDLEHFMKYSESICKNCKQKI